ncbi:MAG TPA: hypothetical protein VLL08_18790 [Kineosporiaceae bacterium]|nr:hypothetical protein [Kineosporiaceae bacterium]
MPDVPPWRFEPTDLAFEASTAMSISKPDALCPEIGRCLLLAQLQFSSWVLRRVEKVSFERERAVSRQQTIEFMIREDAPVFEGKDESYWLVPLSIMRRRTLVNLDLHDEQGTSISLPGLRLNQQLDESVLMAAAAVGGPESVLPGTPGRAFIQAVVTGTKKEVMNALQAFEQPKSTDGLEKLRENPLFTETLYRLRRNFTLYLFLPVDRKRHRLLRMSFEEPTAWRYQAAALESTAEMPAELLRRPGPADIKRDPETVNVHRYQPGFRVSWWHGFCSAIGLTTTRIRFQVPSAEHAASYHFEVKAPLGLRIVRASLVAGRPNNPLRHVSSDVWEGHSATVGLHATEIPYGSLCRAQVELRLPTGGWLTTLAVSCWLIFAVLVSVAFHWYNDTAAVWDQSQTTNVCVLLISTSAGVATLIAQREFGGLAARLLVWMRGLGLVAISLPIVMAAFLTYSGSAKPDRRMHGQEVSSYVTAIAAGVIALFVSIVWILAKADEWRVDTAERQNLPRHGEGPARRSGIRGKVAARVVDSPWDMTRDSRKAADANPDTEMDFRLALAASDFDKASIGIRSAEGWHEWYATTDENHQADLDALSNLMAGALPYHCGDFSTVCARRHECRRTVET